MISDLKEITASVDFFIYRVADDSINISSGTKRSLGINCNDTCYLSNIKSLIIGVDIPVFVQKFAKWLKGDVSEIIQVRIIDAKNQMRTIQIKGHLRYDENQNVVSVYGAFFDISYLGN
ncbi:hypothetical protein [Plebeiibacterium marinum]|uniref:Uncharacterized protein n=1 Tax=Plebeiibacterium marinum TaxID=2992111 RepID=A0AAE3MDV9_9BACT|nr:hypothetical protein [Plebeiobacterium marinum]MCW3805217.1 hypothetical protein [Plebeiobacterium marinum]